MFISGVVLCLGGVLLIWGSLLGLISSYEITVSMIGAAFCSAGGFVFGQWDMMRKNKKRL